MSEFDSFGMPDKKYYPRPLWFWNDKPTIENLSKVIDAAKETGYGGFGILAYDASGLNYLEKDYLDAYRFAIKRAAEKGIRLCLYDEWWFPSGGAGGRLKKFHPEAVAKQLNKYEFEVDSKTFSVKASLPGGKTMAVVAMNNTTKEIINIRSFVSDNIISWTAPSAQWTVMVFACEFGEWDHVNYLDPEAVAKFIEVTHEVYYREFGEYFGENNTIDSSFYDEPQMYAVKGRMWTDNFNEKFKEKFGDEPDELYPALWYDIGEKTSFARNRLLSLRADLYAEGFPKVINEWCNAHGIHLTGHVDQEEMINPCGITGDLMKSFKYQDIPGYDEISVPGRGRKIYKIVSSAANNWDKPLVMSECFGAMPASLTIETMYDEAMEQYAKGMNLLVPHAVWLNPDHSKIIFHPELSGVNPFYKDTLVPFNNYCARMQSILQGGVHKADIAVLYPIEGLQSAYFFDWGGDPYLGGPAPSYADYMDIGDMLSTGVRRDFTFIHPEVLNEKCFISGKNLVMDNDINKESFKVLILPGTDTTSLASMRKALDFYKAGGTVIATTQLPSHTTEEDGEHELKELLLDLLGNSPLKPNTNDAGGFAMFIPSPNAKVLENTLDIAPVTYDVVMKIKDGDPQDSSVISYIHKVNDGKDIYYFVNASPSDIELDVAINKDVRYFTLLDPHNGEKSQIESKSSNSFKCSLPVGAHKSVILISSL